MFRCFLVIFLCLVSCLDATTKADDLPFVSIILPQNIPSDVVQISYYSVGPFGGYGGYAAQQYGVDSYKIRAIVDGKLATEIRAIIYAPGCEIQTFVIPLTGPSPVGREFECQRVETIRLSGQIEPSELARYGNAELVITYIARWSHNFFHIADGHFSQFELAKMPPQADGRFDVELPVIRQDDTRNDAQPSLCLMLRDSRTLDHIAFNLEPDDAQLRSEDQCLKVRTAYPIGMKFTATQFEASTLRGRIFRSDSGEPISNSYILLVGEDGQEKHFDTRTDEAGNYIFGHIPAGKYTVSIYAWFGKRDEVPCKTPLKRKTADGGNVTVEWQWKSQAFMEIVTVKNFSIEVESANVKDFDVVSM